MPIATPQGTLDFKSVDKVTFVGASSNTVIDTTTGSLGVGVGVGGPTSNLHVVGNTRLEGDINMLHTSNTASIKLNSNVVTEFPRSKKLIKYPRVALTSDNQPTGYVASASTSNSADYNAYKAFNNTYESDTTSGWASASLTFSSQVPSGTAASFNGDSGEHLTIQLPNKIKLETHHLFGRQDIRTNEFPVSAKLYASNDNNFTTFELIESYEDLGQPSSSTEAQVHNINETRYFQYYRLMVTKISGTQGYACVGEWELYGTPEYDPEAHGTDVTVKSVANVPNTDWLEVYYDAKNYTNGLVQDLSTNSFNGTLTNGASYNNSDGIDKFVFDAGLNQYMTTTTNISGSAFIHTTSMWVKFVEVSTDSNDQHYLFMLGAFGSNSIGMYYSANQGIRVYVPGFDYRTQYHPVAGKWFHVSYYVCGWCTRYGCYERGCKVLYKR